MKKTNLIRVIALIMALCLTSVIFVGCNKYDTSAETSAQATENSAATPAESQNVKGYCKVVLGDENKTEYEIDLSDALALENLGFTVEIGAILGVASVNGTNVYSVADLTLDAIEAGAKNMKSQLVYASENGMGASYTYTKYEEVPGKAEFAYTIDFGDNAATADATVVEYTAKFVFRGYVKLTDANGNVTVSYVDPTDTWIDGVSLYEVAKILVAGDYAGNKMLGAVIDKVEAAE